MSDSPTSGNRPEPSSTAPTSATQPPAADTGAETAPQPAQPEVLAPDGDRRTTRDWIRSAPRGVAFTAFGLATLLVAGGLFIGGFAVGRVTAPDSPPGPGFPRDGFPGGGDGPWGQFPGGESPEGGGSSSETPSAYLSYSVTWGHVRS